MAVPDSRPSSPHVIGAHCQYHCGDAECDVARGVWPTDVEGFWPGDLAGIAVGGAVEHHHGRVGGNVDPAHVGCSDLGVHLVGGDLKQWFVGFDSVADRFEPACDTARSTLSPSEGKTKGVDTKVNSLLDGTG